MIDLLPPLALSIAASALWWRSLTRPWLFTTVSLLSLAGLQLALRELMFQASFAANHALVSGDAVPGSFMYDLATAALDRHFVIVSALTMILGVPLVAWLRKGLRKR